MAEFIWLHEIAHLHVDHSKQINALLCQLSKQPRAVDLPMLERIVREEKSHILVMMCDEKISGLLTLILIDLLGKRKALIEDVVIDQPLRKQGYGRQLLATAIATAQKLKVSSIDLTSRPERTAANHLYIRHGFVQRTTHCYRLTF